MKNAKCKMKNEERTYFPVCFAHYWPEFPECPPTGVPVLVRMPLPTASRAAARREARAALRAVLAAWTGHEPVLEETPQGPLIRGEAIDVSLSYGAGEAWIGLIRGGRIGVDVMAVEPFAELNDVALDYLGPAAAARIRQAADPARAFAAAWTEHEAQLKCAKRSLSEWTGAELAASVETIAGPGAIQGAVAYAPG
jgi:hypothetical protein